MGKKNTTRRRRKRSHKSQNSSCRPSSWVRGVWAEDFLTLLSCPKATATVLSPSSREPFWTSPQCRAQTEQRRPGRQGPQGRGCAVISPLSWEGKPPSLLLVASFLICPAPNPHWLPILTGSQGNQCELDFKLYPQAKSFSQTASHLSYLCSPLPPVNPPFVLTKWT